MQLKRNNRFFLYQLMKLTADLGPKTEKWNQTLNYLTETISKIIIEHFGLFLGPFQMEDFGILLIAFLEIENFAKNMLHSWQEKYSQ